MVHATALIDPAAEVPDDAEIGPFTVVHGNVRLGAGCRIGSHCSIGEPTPLAEGRPLEVGDGALIRSHSIFYEGSTFGPGLQTGHRVTVREATRAGRDLQLGTLCDIQGDLRFGDHVRLHSNVHCGKLSDVGSYVWIFPYVVLTNDPHPPSDGFHVGVTIEDFAVVATMSTVLPGVRVGSRSLVGAQSLVRKDVASGTVVVGVPAKEVGEASRVALSDGSGPAYPWTRHFHRGYPEDIVAGWKAEHGC
ncbi:acyltransferase [Conexibacter sp. SYSU D00693]|uniref:acyltransferase n=1 Tax=Conexibacter sp. SYSU D00693 TaxID=2812560 RepID=UPI00196ADDCF|nr:acyltransferase [Conexibacter sp. SYSU D00693]